MDEYDSDWGELFFDLIYVAMAFKLGDIIADGVEDENYGETALFFFSIYVVMNDAWFSRVTYYSRFYAVGLVHQVVDILEGKERRCKTLCFIEGLGCSHFIVQRCLSHGQLLISPALSCF